MLILLAAAITLGVIGSLSHTSKHDAQFDAKMAVLREEIDHHVEEEEGELFPKVQKLLADDELDDLGTVMEDLADELKEDGAPRAHVPAETGEATGL